MGVMHASQKAHIAVLLTTGLLIAGQARAQDIVPRKEQWGEPRAGVQVSLSAAGPAAVGGKLPLTLVVRNVGRTAVTFSKTEPAFAWFTVVRTRDEAWLTEKIALKTLAPDWPGRLIGKTSVEFKAFDLAPHNVYPYALGREILKTYLGVKGAKPLPPTKGTLAGTLRAGAMIVRCRLVLPRPADKPLILTSNKLTVDVAPPDLSALGEAPRKAYVAKLLKQFDRDPWSGQAACATSVKIGTSVVPYLAKAAFERSRPGHSRLWITAAIAQIRCETSVRTLVKLLEEADAGVRQVVAYHGPAQRSEVLDKAIRARTLAMKDPRMTALALVGFLAHRGTVHDDLLAASLDSEDPRVRTAAAAALSGHASAQNVLRITALLKDKHERVRGAAAATLGAMGSKGAETVRTRRVAGALIEALDAPGEVARQRICAALGVLTGKERPYDPSAAPTDREKTLAAWRNWWKDIERK